MARKGYVSGLTQLAAFREWLPPDFAADEAVAVEVLVTESAQAERGLG